MFVYYFFSFVFFFFKQKTAYEMRISDWSSDVCSSDLGSTRPDFTNYIETAPVSALEPILWLEADRMKTLDFNPVTLKNQQDVVKEEIRVNVKNQPYGGFMWIDIGQLAFNK